MCALSWYSCDNGGDFPLKLNDIQNKEYLPDKDVYQWIHPLTAKTDLPFIYRPGLRDDDVNAMEMPLVVAPEPYAGKRLVLFVAGNSELKDEKAFQKLAQKNGWKVSKDPEKFAGSDEVRDKVLKLFKQLGSESFKERRDARVGLKKFGGEILPLLEKELTNDDPEIRQTIKEIIESL